MSFLEDVLADAVAHEVELPGPPDVLRGAVAAQFERLDQVTTASLVHFDLWDGNLFVTHDADGSPTLEAVIDAERCFYGDPLAEYASLTLTASAPEVADRAGRYRGQPLSEDEGARLHLYRLYLLLIMLVEPTARGYDPVAHEPVRQWVTQEIDHGLGVLALRYC